MKVKDCMMPEPLTVCRDESVDRIAELIRMHGIRQVPVVDAANRLIGIVTDRDIRSAVGPDEHDTLSLVAGDIMTADVITTTPGADLSEAVDILCHNAFGALPVVVGDHVMGIIDTRELLRRMKEMLGDDAERAAARSLATFEADIL